MTPQRVWVTRFARDSNNIKSDLLMREDVVEESVVNLWVSLAKLAIAGARFVLKCKDGGS